MLFGKGGELLVGVVDEPLVVDPPDVDLASAPADNFQSEVPEEFGFAGVDHGLLHLVLGLFDAESGELAADVLHAAHVVAVLVDGLLGFLHGLLEFLGVLDVGDLHLGDDVLSREVAVTLDGDDGNGFHSVDDLLGDSVDGGQVGVGLCSLQGIPVGGCV